jgi:hypothetical protein
VEKANDFKKTPQKIKTRNLLSLAYPASHDLIKNQKHPPDPRFESYEMLCGHLFLTNDLLLDREISEQTKDIHGLGQIPTDLQLFEVYPRKNGNQHFHPGDMVLIKSLTSLTSSLGST